MKNIFEEQYESGEAEPCGCAAFPPGV